MRKKRKVKVKLSKKRDPKKRKKVSKKVKREIREAVKSAENPTKDLMGNPKPKFKVKKIKKGTLKKVLYK